MAMNVTFWGVRGSFPCATPNHMKYGGNTSCVSVEAAGQTVILDAGTGMHALGKDLLKRQVSSATLLMSHTHTDHIIGFPFFAPAWIGKFQLTMMAGHLTDNGGIRDIFVQAMRDPVFPVKLDDMGGNTKFVDFMAGQTLTLSSEVTVRTAPLNHPNGATAYRIEAEGKSVCYVTDTEHVPGQLDQNILKLIEGADLFIYDSTYTDAEFPTKVGWGHSTWQEGVRLADAAKVKKLAIFHHDPDHTDLVMDGIAAELLVQRKGSIVATEGVTVTL